MTRRNTATSQRVEHVHVVHVLSSSPTKKKKNPPQKGVTRHTSHLPWWTLTLALRNLLPSVSLHVQSPHKHMPCRVTGPFAQAGLGLVTPEELGPWLVPRGETKSVRIDERTFGASVVACPGYVCICTWRMTLCVRHHGTLKEGRWSKGGKTGFGRPSRIEQTPLQIVTSRSYSHQSLCRQSTFAHFCATAMLMLAQ